MNFCVNNKVLILKWFFVFLHNIDIYRSMLKRKITKQKHYTNYNAIKNSDLKIDFDNKKTEPEQKFGFGSFGSPGPVRTDDLPVNSRLLHR